MSEAIAKLLTSGSRSIGGSGTRIDALQKWGIRGDELATMLQTRNGFYAYESALLVRPLCNEHAPLGLFEWNASQLWKAEFKDDLDDALFFAEDVFGGQFCIKGSSVCTFDPEIGQFEVMGSSLDDWASDVMARCEFRTGYPLAHAWQSKHGPLRPGKRLLPRIPFVCGGKYEIGNLYVLDDVQAMLFRASIANQIRDLPDGAKISFKID